MVDLFQPLVDMLWDVAPIALVLFGFQLLILKQKIPHLKRVVIGFVLVWIGLTLFIVGLDLYQHLHSREIKAHGTFTSNEKRCMECYAMT
jgi:uncharacterized membrane protein YidH (DUF202 family)